MNISMWKEYLRKNREYILLGVLALVQAANLFALHLFINRRFIGYGKVILAVMNLPGVQYNTPEYAQALNTVSLVLSAVIGGMLVLGMCKLPEKLASELTLPGRPLYAGILPAGFWAVHLLGVLGLWIFNKNLYEWLCPLLAYTAGLGLWAVTVKKDGSKDEYKSTGDY